MDAFPCQPDQQGIIVFILGKPAGLEYLSLPGCYQQVHEKLIRSYAMEAIRVWGRDPAGDTGKDEAENDAVQEEEGSSFLSRISSAPVTQYPSPGMGEDYRIAKKEVAGSALVCENEVIHMAVFTVPTSDGNTRSGNECDRKKLLDGLPLCYPICLGYPYHDLHSW